MTTYATENPFLLKDRRIPASGDQSWQPKAIRRWINTLPQANASVTAFELHTRLEMLNSLEFPVDDRYQSLECILKPLQGVLDSLTKIYSLETLPLSPRAEEALAGLRGLCAAAVVGYKAILQQTRADSLINRVRRKTTRAVAMHRMIYLAGRMLLSDYHLYRPCSEHLWREIHRIYRYAAEWKLHTLAVSDEEPVLRTRTSVEDKYKQIILLALASPYRLSRAEVDSVYVALQRWAPFCRLRRYRADYPEGAVFYVDGHGDESPVYLDLERHRPDTGLILDPRPMADELAVYLESLNDSNGLTVSAVRPKEEPGSLPAGLVRRLMLFWGFETKRANGREEVSGEVLVSSGLDDFWSLLGGAVDRDDGIEQILIESNSAADRRVDTKGEPWNPRGRAEIESIDIQDDGKACWRGLKKRTDATIGVCRICNRSEGGYHLQWQGGDSLKLRVGDLVGVNEDTGSASVAGWRAGVVRWFRASPSARFECGVQIFEDDILPAMVYRKRRNSPYEEQWQSLLMTSRTVGAESLIAPSFYAEEGDEMRLVRGDREEHIVPEQVLECSGSFVQFRFRVSDGDTGETEVDGNAGEGNGFLS